MTSGTDSAVITQSMFWDDVLAPQKLSMDKVHAFGGDLIRGVGPVNHVKLNIYPDGGISRLRVFGRLA